MADVGPIQPDDLKAIGELIARALNPAAGLNEEQKTEIELIHLIHNSFDPARAMHRIADQHDNIAQKDSADLFASGILGHLREEDGLKDQSQVAFLYQRQIVAHWLRTYEKHLNGEEV